MTLFEVIATDADALEDYNRCHSAWTSYKLSRYKQFAKQTRCTNLLEQPDEFEDMKRWGPSLQGTRQVRQIPVPSAEHLLLDTNGDICLRCSRLNFKEMNKNVLHWYTSSYLLGKSFQVSQNPNCSICRLLSRLLQEHRHDGRKDDTNFYLAAFPTSALYGENWIWQKPPDGVAQTVSFSIFDEITFHDMFAARQPYLVRAIGCISPVLANGNLAGFQARKTSNEVDVAVIKAWLNYCSHHHLGSCTSAEDPLHPSTRVINFHSRTVVYLEPGHTYLALSYIWGKKGDMEVEGGKASSTPGLKFPQTVKDAIGLTEILGYSYLWVDRFCIPQDEESERQVQIAQMDRIYAGAEATIIAAAGDGPS